MASRVLNLLIDQEGGRRVASFASAQQGQPLRFTFGDSVPLIVRILAAGVGAPWQDADLTDQTIRVAIGDPAGQPTAGTWAITYGANTTSALAYNASAATVETALNALTSITAAGGVTVTKSTDGPYRIVFVSAGARTAFSIDTVGLYPTTGADAIVATEGDGSTREIVLIRLETQPAAYVELTAALPAAAGSVTTIQEGAAGVSDVQRITLDPAPVGGVFTLTLNTDTTGAIPWNATTDEIETAIEALTGIGVGNVTVTGESPTWDVTFAASLTDVTEMTLDASGLVAPVGRSGNLDLNVAGLLELLDGADSATAKLEVEVYDTNAATSWTVLQENCTVQDDAIGNSPASSTPLPTYLTTSTSAATLATMLGLATYADLTAANAALAPGIPYYDTALARINISTA